ncbi:MAG: hypothetical protein ACREBR_00360 [bacterium]
MSKSLKDTKRIRYIDRRVPFVRQGTQAGRHFLTYISANFQLADNGTKNLDHFEAAPRLSYITTSVKD